MLCFSKFARSIAKSSLCKSAAKYSTVSTGEKYTEGYKLFCTKKESGQDKKISFWHDIATFHEKPSGKNTGIVNFVCEIPRLESAKFEISKEDTLNPIHQDMKNGKPRYYSAPCMIHYGAVPQTYESPKVEERTDIGVFKGDDDPLDIMDFSMIPVQSGDVYQVKVFGAFGLVDQNEMDWKLLGVNIQDPLYKQMRDYLDFSEIFKDRLEKMREWLIIYKIPEGKAANSLAFGGIPIHDQETLEKVILPAHQHYEELLKDKENNKQFYYSQ